MFRQVVQGGATVAVKINIDRRRENVSDLPTWISLSPILLWLVRAIGVANLGVPMNPSTAPHLWRIMIHAFLRSDPDADWWAGGRFGVRVPHAARRALPHRRISARWRGRGSQLLSEVRVGHEPGRIGTDGHASEQISDDRGQASGGRSTLNTKAAASPPVSVRIRSKECMDHDPPHDTARSRDSSAHEFEASRVDRENSAESVYTERSADVVSPHWYAARFPLYRLLIEDSRPSGTMQRR